MQPQTRSLNIVRYLTFEVNKTCDMVTVHPQCPIGHPERYKFGDTSQHLTAGSIFKFWRWARASRNFRGIILWHSYNEPTLAISLIRECMKQIKSVDPYQPFHLFTNVPPNSRPDLIPEFDIITYSDYDPHSPDYSKRVGSKLDDRISNRTGEGKPYSAVKPTGWCGRGFGWELLIDYHGNWNLCCSDWRGEEAVGNILVDSDWSSMLARYEDKARNIRWHDEASYNALPRLCRACMDVTPNLHRSGQAL